MMKTTERVKDGVIILAIIGRILPSEGDDFLKRMKRSIAENSLLKLVLDLTEFEHLDSTGLGKIMYIFNYLRERGGDLKLANPPERVRTVFKIAKLDEIIKIYSTVNRAVKAFK